MVYKIFDKIPVGAKAKYDFANSGLWTYQLYDDSSFQKEIRVGYSLTINLNIYSYCLNKTYLEALSCKPNFTGTIIVPYQIINKQYLCGLVAINGLCNDKYNHEIYEKF